MYALTRQGMAEKHRPAILQSSSQCQLVVGAPSANQVVSVETGGPPATVGDGVNQVHFMIEGGLQNSNITETCDQDDGKAQVFLICNDQFTCGFCAEQFSNLPLFLSHKAKHPIGEDLFKCELCSSVVSGHLSLTIHYKDLHQVNLDPKPMVLTTCQPGTESDKSTQVNEVQVTILQTEADAENGANSSVVENDKCLASWGRGQPIKRRVGRPKKRKSTHQVRRDEAVRPEDNFNALEVFGEQKNDRPADECNIDPDYVAEDDASEADPKTNVASLNSGQEGGLENVNTQVVDFMFFLLTELVKGRTVSYEKQWLQCLHCVTRTRTRNTLEKHMSDNHSAVSWTKIDAEFLKKRKEELEKTGVKVVPMMLSVYITQHCSEGKPRGLKRPRKIEKQDIPGVYPCGQCGKVFTRLRYLRKHTETHRTSKEYICDVCGQSFKSQAYLRVHKRVHQDKVFSCNQCNFTSSNNPAIRMHRQIHSQGSVLCDICGYAYTDRSTLAKHKRVHDLSRPFACSYPGCMWRFKTEIMCKAHIRAHYTEGKFRCLYCGYIFRHKHHLLRHESNIHGVKTDKTTAIISDEVLEPEVSQAEVVTTECLPSDAVGIIVNSDLSEQLDLTEGALVVTTNEGGGSITYETHDISAYEALTEREAIIHGVISEGLEGDHTDTVVMTTEEEIAF